MKIGVVYWGPSAEWAGRANESLNLPDGISLDKVIAILQEKYPQFTKRSHTIRFAVNDKFAIPSAEIKEGDEIAVIPPVSGGQPDAFISLADQPIDREAILAGVRNVGAAGAVVVFEGVTRRETHPTHGELVRLEYEAQEPLATSEMRRLAIHARKQWKLAELVMVHRIGAVEIGQVSVLIATFAGHRAEAFDACRWLIDTLKHDVPIWKKEVWADGSTEWVEPSEC